MDWNNLDDTEWKKDVIESSFNEKTYKKFVSKTHQVIEKIKNIGLPVHGEQLRIITMKPINIISLVKLICEGEVCNGAIFMIYAINKYAAQELIELKKSGYLKNVQLVISDLRNTAYKSKLLAIDMLRQHFDMIFVNTHAKISILKTEKGNYYNMEGSGNFSFNAKIEQYIIDNDKGIYEFSKDWMEEVKKFEK